MVFLPEVHLSLVNVLLKTIIFLRFSRCYPGVWGISQYYPSYHLLGASPAEIQYVILDQGDRVQSATRSMHHGLVDLAHWVEVGLKVGIRYSHKMAHEREYTDDKAVDFRAYEFPQG